MKIVNRWLRKQTAKFPSLVKASLLEKHHIYVTNISSLLKLIIFTSYKINCQWVHITYTNILVWVNYVVVVHITFFLSNTAHFVEMKEEWLEVGAWGDQEVMELTEFAQGVFGLFWKKKKKNSNECLRQTDKIRNFINSYCLKKITSQMWNLLVQ